MQDMWQIDIDTYLEIVELAKTHGKKVGDSMQEEFEEVLKKKRDKIKYLGILKGNLTRFIYNLRKKGLRILDLRGKKDET